MANKRLSGTKNYLYAATLGAEIEGDGAAAIATAGYYKITGKKATGSALPATAVVGDVVYLTTGDTPEIGDDVQLMTLTKVGFVTDIPNQAAKEKFEDTVQIDDARSYEEGDKPEITGTFEGYFVLGDETVDEVLGRFFTITTDDGAGSIVVVSPKTGVLHFMLGRNETAVVGEVHVFQYMPVIIDNLDAAKPMQGKQTFRCQYTVIGSERPTIYKRTVV